MAVVEFSPATDLHVKQGETVTIDVPVNNIQLASEGEVQTMVWRHYGDFAELVRKGMFDKESIEAVGSYLQEIINDPENFDGYKDMHPIFTRLTALIINGHFSTATEE